MHESTMKYYIFRNSKNGVENAQSFAYTWLHDGNQNEFLKHPKIKHN